MTVTPKAIAGYAKNLYEKDTEGKFAKNKFKFEVRMPKGDDSVEEFVKFVRKAHKDAGGNPYCPVKDGDEIQTANEKRREYAKGHWLFSAKTDYQPKLVDSQKKPLPHSVQVMGGDIVRVAFTMKPYDAQGGGVTAYLDGVMLVEKRTGGGVDEFEVEEGGFTAPADPFAEGTPAGASKGNGGDF